MAAAQKSESKKPGTNIVDVKALLAKEAANVASRIQAGGGDRVRLTKDKFFQLPGGEKNPGPLTVVILDFITRNEFYDRPWKDGEVMPPACFAIGENPTTMVPDSTSPDVQAKACNECPNNEFGSKGAGKACSNSRLLAVTEDSDNKDAPIYLLKVPAGSIKAFDAYVATIKSQFDTMPVGVVTDIYFDKNKEHQALLFGNPMPNENLELHFSRRKDATNRLLAKPDVSQYEAPKKGRR